MEPLFEEEVVVEAERRAWEADRRRVEKSPGGVRVDGGGGGGVRGGWSGGPGGGYGGGHTL